MTFGGLAVSMLPRKVTCSRRRSTWSRPFQTPSSRPPANYIQSLLKSIGTIYLPESKSTNLNEKCSCSVDRVVSCLAVRKVIIRTTKSSMENASDSSVTLMISTSLMICLLSLLPFSFLLLHQLPSCCLHCSHSFLHYLTSRDKDQPNYGPGQENTKTP